MLPEEWPLAACAADRPVEPARSAGSARLRTVRADFFLDPGNRLTEEERALMTALLDHLVAGIADELVRALGDPFADAADAQGAALVPLLARAGILDRDDLIALLLRRTEEERIAGAMHARLGNAGPNLVQSMVSDEDADVSEAAMLLIVARGLRRDRFGRLQLDFCDLPAEAAVPLVNAVAAALRPAIRAVAAAEGDRALQAAVTTVLAGHDEGRRLDAQIAALARALDGAGRLDDALLLAAADDGEVALLAHGLARRAGILANDSWEALVTRNGALLGRLLRMAGCPRPVAAGIFAGIGQTLRVADAASAIGEFDAIDGGTAAAAIAWLRLDPAYRAAVDRMEGVDGQRRQR